MRILGALCIAVAVGGCQRDRAEPAEQAAPVEVSPAEPIIDPGAARPILVQDSPPEPADGLDCFRAPRRTPVDQWLSVHAVADMNGDGHLDAVVGYDILREEFTAYVAIYLGDGDGGFRAADEIAIGPMSYDVAVADFDEDGDLDLLVPSVKERKVVVLLGRGDGTMARAADVEAGPRPGQISAADVNGDGHVDAVLLHDRQYQILLGDGRGRFQPQPVVKAEEAPEEPAIVDLDGDGALDMLMVYNDSMTAVALRGRGDGTFARADRLEQVCDAPYSVVGGDFDGDGAPEAAFSCLRTDAIGVLRNAGRGKRLELGHVRAEMGQALAVGDVTGDGVVDLVGLGQRPGRPMLSNATILAGDGKGGFSTRSTAILDGHAGDPLLADVNGDGRLDLVASLWTGRRPGSIAVWFGAACSGGTVPN